MIKLTKNEALLIKEHVRKNAKMLLKYFVLELKIKAYKAKNMQPNIKVVSVHVIEDILKKYKWGNKK